MTRQSILAIAVGSIALLAAGGARAAVSDTDIRCQDCVTGPWSVSQGPGDSSVDAIDFVSFAGTGYELVIRSWSLSGAGASIALNGVELLDVRGSAARGAPPSPLVVALQDANSLRIDLRGPGGELTVEIRATDDAALPTCGPPTQTEFFHGPLTPVADLVAWEPLGTMNAPSHTLPTHHSYPNPPRDPAGTTAYPIMSPGKVRLVAAEYSPEDDDFSLHLRPCDEVRMYLLHVKRLGPRLQARLGDPSLWSPIPAIVSGFPGSAALTAIDIAPGEALGVTGIGERTGYDVGLIDVRQPALAFVNPDRYLIPTDIIPGLDPAIAARLLNDVAPQRLWQFCALDYFEPTLGARYEALLGEFDGSVQRIEPPICGEHMQDLPGTAQGNWFRPTGPGEEPSTAIDEADDFAFVHDPIEPALPYISLGERGPVIMDGAAVVNELTYPLDLAAGALINADPSAITPGDVYCFDNLSWRGGPVPGEFLLHMPDVDTIRVAYVAFPIACTDLLASLPPDEDLSGPGGIEYVR